MNEVDDLFETLCKNPDKPKVEKLEKFKKEIERLNKIIQDKK